LPTSATFPAIDIRSLDHVGKEETDLPPPDQLSKDLHPSNRYPGPMGTNDGGDLP